MARDPPNAAGQGPTLEQSKKLSGRYPYRDRVPDQTGA